MRRTTKSKNGHIVTLGKHDVVCGKGRGKHEKTSGNLFYRSLINEKKDGYNDSNTIERVTLIGEIRELIEGKGGVFVQPASDSTGDDAKYIPMALDKIRKKISDDLRREIRRRRARVSASGSATKKSPSRKRSENLKNKANKPDERSDREQEDVDSLDEFKPKTGREDVSPSSKTSTTTLGSGEFHQQVVGVNLESVLNRGARPEMGTGSVLQGIRAQASGARFLDRPPPKLLYDISEASTLEKISHALSSLKHARVGGGMKMGKIC